MEDITRITLSPDPVEVPEPEKETPVEAIDEPKVEIPQVDDHTPDDILKERVGLSISDIENLKKEYESLKGRPYVEDPELVPDDDFLKGFIKTYKRGGNAAAYLEAMTTDFSKMSAEEIVKYEVRKSNPGLPEKFIQRKVDDFLKKEFGIMPEYDSDEDEAYAKELLRIHTEKKRAEFEEDRKKYQIPERKQQEDVQEQIDAFNKSILENQVTKGVMEGKRVTFEDFNYQVEPDLLVGAALDSAKFFNLFNRDGQPDLDKFYKVTAFAKDPEQFLKAYTAHSLAKAKIEWLKELKNPSSEPRDKPKSGQVSVRLV